MITIEISDQSTVIRERVMEVTPADIYNSGAFDEMILGTGIFAGTPRKIHSIKYVRQITQAGLKETKDAMDARLFSLGALPARLY